MLQSEIDSESKSNMESIGLEMATAEKVWIEQNFGVQAKPGTLNMPFAMANLNSPTSPRSPGGGRLMEKLKGLKLGTSSGELLSGGTPPNETNNPLSPEGSDVAVSSFGSFAALKGMPPPSVLAAKSAQAPHTQRRITVQRPPEPFVAQQHQQVGMGSLNAFASGDTGSSRFSSPTIDDDAEDDLFAMPMSPRSPEMTKSPFSFGSQDTVKYAKGEKA